MFFCFVDREVDLAKKKKLVPIFSTRVSTTCILNTAARNKYICSNYLMVQPRWGTPLKPRATYAAIITNGVQSTPNVDDEVESAQRIDDTAALLSDQSPSDAALTEAWNSYQPLRDYLASGSGMDAASIVGATVFTTNSPTDRMQDVYDAVIQAEQIAIATSPVLCKAGTTSPCSEILGAADTTDAGTEASRDCPENPDPDFHEIPVQALSPMHAALQPAIRAAQRARTPADPRSPQSGRGRDPGSSGNRWRLPCCACSW